MDRSEFRAPGAGRVATTRDGYAAFVPASLPPRLTYTKDLVLALSRADAALGELSGVGGELPDPRLLGASFERQEALCSARIEGTGVTLSDLLLDQVSAAPATASRDDLREVRDCIATLRLGAARLEETPLSMELVRELHGRLLRNEVGGARMPGAFRTEPIRWPASDARRRILGPFVAYTLLSRRASKTASRVRSSLRIAANPPVEDARCASPG